MLALVVEGKDVKLTDEKYLCMFCLLQARYFQ